MAERSDYKSSKGKHGERSRGDEWSERSKWSVWDKVDRVPPPPPTEDYPPLPGGRRDSKQSQEESPHSEENEEFAELAASTKGFDASSSSSSSKKKKKFKIPGPNGDRLVSDVDLFEILKGFVKNSCSFDSYGAMLFCTGNEKDSKLLEMKYFSRNLHALNVPAALPVRVDQDESMAKEDPASIAHRIVLQLVAEGRVGTTDGGGWGYRKPPPRRTYDAEMFPMDGKGGVLMRPILQDTRANRFRANKVNLLTIEYESETTWGIVAASPIEHSYQLSLKRITFRIKANLVPKVEDVEWSPKNLEVVEKFHRRIIGDEQGEPDLMLVKVKRKEFEAKCPATLVAGSPYEIDFVAMEDPEDHQDEVSRVHPHFCALLKKMDRLAWWELVRMWGPAEPAASPLKLHKIFDQPEPDEMEEFQNDVECMKQSGLDSLRLAAAVAESSREREVECPDLSWDYLEKKIEENYLDRNLAAQLMALSGFINMGTRKNVSKEDAATMFFALIGAHKMESDMFSVGQLWDYFITDPHNFDQVRPSGLKKLSVRANEYTAAIPRFLGRTPSYIEFGEVWDIEEGPNGPVKVKALKVRYEDYSDAFYRWNSSQAEEKRPDTPGHEDWKPLTFEHISGSFCSPSMKLPDGQPRSLPNKVCAWLRGRSMKKLVSIKHSIDITPAYKYLREDIVDGELVLYVEYKLYGKFCYKRDNHGGLGEETCEEVTYFLSYSENKKTLVSGHIQCALPRKVVTWLLEARNLADLIPGRKRQIHDLEYDSDKVQFKTKDGTAVQVQARKLKSPKHSGCLFEVFVDDDPKPKEVSYSEDRKEWVFFAGMQNEELIPWEAISYITDKCSTETGPRLQTPSSVRKYFPKASGTAVARIEQQTDHRFMQIKLLSEALTHCSAVNSAVQPCDQLAFVGLAAMECFASETVLKNVSFFNSHLVTGEGPVNHKTFCAPKACDWDQMTYDPAAKSESEDPPGTVQIMLRRLMACCNHVSYAYSCVRNDLHKSINHGSMELQDHIDRVCKKMSNREPNWRQVYKLGAPKALGDVFLAIIGAITLDSDHNEARHLMSKHYKESSEIFKAIGDVELRHHTLSRDPPLPLAQIKEALQQKEKLKEQELALVHSLHVDQRGDLPDFAPHCKDLHVVKVEGQGNMACSSPRAAVISLQMAASSQDKESDDESDDSLGVVEDAAANGHEEQEGAIFCHPCQMWLNGPTQWADHEIGKKHRKAVHRMQAEKQEIPPIEKEEPKKEVVEEPKKPADKEHESHEAIYCKHCEMWLNGPTQWADHEIGKKHLKAIRRDQGEEEPSWRKDKEFSMSSSIMQEAYTTLSSESYGGSGKFSDYPREYAESYSHDSSGALFAPWAQPVSSQYDAPYEDIPVPVEWQ